METTQGIKRNAEGVKVPDAKRQQLPNQAAAVPESTTLPSKVEMFRLNERGRAMLPNYAHRRSKFSDLALQVPGKIGVVLDRPLLINYSRGRIHSKDPATWPDEGCYLSDTIMAEVIEADLPPCLRTSLWPLNFDSNGPRTTDVSTRASDTYSNRDRSVWPL